MPLVSTVSRSRRRAEGSAARPSLGPDSADSPALTPAAEQKATTIEIAVIAIAVVAVVAAARIAETFIVPVVAGMLLSYMLRPIVSILERAHVPRLGGAAVVVVVLVALVSASVYAVRDEVDDAMAKLPVAARKLRQVAIEFARAPPGPMGNVKAAAAELDRAAAEAAGKIAAPQPSSPAVTVQTFIAEQSVSALIVAVQTVVAVTVAFFLLAAGDTFRRKVTRLAGEPLARRRVTVEILNEIDEQIQRYLMTMFASNVLIALLVWGGLSLLHISNAGMWGAITGVLHFIPYAGTVVAAAGVGVSAFVQSGGVVDAILAMALIVCVVEAVGGFLAVWLQGRAARMNAVAVFIGVLFFGWLWGGWGLLLGMPILVVLKSIADRIDAMRSISELLGA